MKRFFLKILLFSTLVVTLQFYMPLPRDLQFKIKKIDTILRWKPDVIYFGDSTLNWTAPSDRLKLSMPALLKALLPGSVVVKLVHPSYQMAIYKENLRFFILKKYYPKCVIFPINLRSFSPIWEWQPLWQFEEEVTLINSMLEGWIWFYKPLTVFKLNHLKLTGYEYLRKKVYMGDKEVGRVRDFDNLDYFTATDENIRRQMVVRYMYPLSEDHRFIRSMLEIVRMSKAAGIEPVFYITPIDFQTGVRYVGPAFTDQVEKNVAFIQQVLSAEGVEALDLSRSLGTKYFSWPEDVPTVLYPNEHLKLRGRIFVVENLHQFMRLKKLP
ncbi:MAG TPA: hypothetical protein PLB05_05595 [Candidatus Omnitrophota bacterium]|jgi:hypothetical protein|nr:hypothetical protein [Candidatus Omnitrophota bacterium]HPN55769.1 hypothetical protein [Candidatus Omnitrophota bacterium]